MENGKRILFGLEQKGQWSVEFDSANEMILYLF